MPYRFLRSVGILAVFLAAWEFVGQLPVTGVRIVPAPSAIVAQYVADWDIYLAHITATVHNAAIGFVCGNTIAIAAALMFCRFPLTERIFHGVNIVMFALPMIVIGPILVLVCNEGVPQIVLSAMAVYFPSMAATLVGLRDVDPRLVDVITTYGGNRTTIMRLVQLRGALPSIFAGLRIAASLAVLGAILGEFGSGERWGLGTYLLGSLSQANSARLWGISIAAGGIAMLGYGAFAFAGRRLLGATLSVTIAATRLPSQIASKDTSIRQRLPTDAVAVTLPILLWAGILHALALSPIIAPGPIDTFRYLFIDADSAEARATLFHALGQTLPVAGLGLIVGLAAAFLFAVMVVLAPRSNKVFLPIALVLQSIPLVALAPLAMLLFGRETTSATALAVIIVFFPGFVLLSQGFSQVPKAATEIVAVYGGSAWRSLIMVSLPYSTRYLFAAAKLVAPRALLGVMVAEWLLTGKGLGNLLDFSRASLDYGMVWSGAAASVIIAVLFYGIVALLEAFLDIR